MRGRLIFPVIARLELLDTVATEADADAGYDPWYREPLRSETTGETNIVRTALSLPVQVEPEMFQRLNMLANGNSPDSRILVVAHRRYLEENSLLDPDGLPSIRQGTRLVGFSECGPDGAPGASIFNVPENPGLHLWEIQPRGFGFGRTVNLLVMDFRNRQRGTRG